MERENIPRVGVALLAYNQGKYIDDAIESLKKQSFQDFEVILIDDGSDDGFTSKKLESIEYEKIKSKFLHKDNVGSPKRRKQYDEILRNEYIIDFCGDDILAPTFFEKTVEFLDKNSEYGAVCTNLYFFKHNINDKYFEKKYDSNTMRYPDMLVSCNMLGSSLMRRSALDGLDLDWCLRRYYDWNRWNAMLGAGWKLGLVPETLFYYRQVDTSLTHTSDRKEEIKFRKELINRYRSVFKKYDLEIILQAFENIAVLQESKDWLDRQYDFLNEEICRLNNELKDLKGNCYEKKLRENTKVR